VKIQNAKAVQELTLQTIKVEENMSLGYIKVFRSVQNKGWYKKTGYAHLFFHLLLKAAHSGYETWFKDGTVRLKPGQLITGRKKLSEETGIHESKVQRILILFEKEKQIEQQTCNASRLITIVNWNWYQSREQHTDQRVNNWRTTRKQHENTIQERKKNDNSFKKGENVMNNSPAKKNYTNFSEQDFYHEVIKHDCFDAKLLNSFFKHWSEPVTKNKMRLQREDEWNTYQRLLIWKEKNENA
jgi:hypothetical protein